jgi:Fe-Mn family superoxide dismutase
MTPTEAQPVAAGPPPAGPYTLPRLSFACDALEPYMDARTVEIHHGKHHAIYVQNLNKAVAGFPEVAARPIEELLQTLNSVPEPIRTAVRNHGGGHANHALFWQILKKNEGALPTGGLAQAIGEQFGGMAAFQQEFTKAALGQFGSGWAWLTCEGGRLRIEATSNQDTPLSQGRIPLLTIDVWEHAYYLKYQNRRADFVAAFYNLIDWEAVAERYRMAAR